MADVASWSISSVLVSVIELDRSMVFYQDVMNLPEVFREDQIAILGDDSPGGFTLMLRETHRGALRPGQQSLGVRSLMIDVGSRAELDRVQERLRVLDALRGRQFFDEAERFEFVAGHDPDRLPLIFTMHEPGEIPSAADYHHGLTRMYGVDA